jgi:hypothetical protein
MCKYRTLRDGLANGPNRLFTDIALVAGNVCVYARFAHYPPPKIVHNDDLLPGLQIPPCLKTSPPLYSID